MKYLASLTLTITMSLATTSPGSPPPSISDEQLSKFARLALDGIGREYPNKPSNVMAGRDDVRSPRELHPVFFGSFDWHSSVHGHWMLARLLKLYPEATAAQEIRAALNQQFTAPKLKVEADYFDAKHNASFERMYGWAWTLRLAAELRSWDGDADAQTWAGNLAPLEQKIVSLAKAYLPKLDWPIRCGFHPESAFALGQMLDYARVCKDADLEKLVVEKALAFYRDDRDYPAGYEPSGNDFFSAGLNEADLMRRLFNPQEFSDWLDGFFPELSQGRCGNLLAPVSVSDVNDGHLVHLAGLNLTRAWTMAGILSALEAEDPRTKTLADAMAAHQEAGLAYVFSGSYEGEHWLASFAIYLLTGVGLPGR
ncbi:MAG: DUF2891 domain-containing protein [Verrucomicrobiales bacterium]